MFVGEQPGNEEDLAGQPFPRRSCDDETRRLETRRFVDDLKKVAKVLGEA